MRRLLALSIAALLLSSPAAAGPKHRHFWRSKTFWIAFAIDAGASFADYAEAQHAWIAGSHEIDPIFGAQRPSFGRMMAVGLPITFGVSYLSFRMSESRHMAIRYLAPLPVAYDVANHVRWAISNARVSTCVNQDICGSLGPKF